MCSPRYLRLAVLIPCLCVVVAFSNTLYNEWQFDDHHSILENESIRSLSNVGRFFTDARTFSGRAKEQNFMYRPLLLVGYAVTYAVAGLSLPAWHAVQIGLHLMCTVLVFRLMQTVDRSLVTTVVAACLWAVHPIQTHPVNYMCSRSEIQASIFMLAALLCVIRRHTDGGRRHGIAAGFFLGCALMTKSIAVVVPVLMALWYRWLGPGADENESWSSTFRMALPYVALVVIYLVVRFVLLGAVILPLSSNEHQGIRLLEDHPFEPARASLTGRSVPTNVLVQATVFFLYLYLLVWPPALSPIHAVDPSPSLTTWPTVVTVPLLLGLVVLELLGVAPPRLPEGAVACTLPMRSEHAIVLLVVYCGLFGLASFLLLGLNQSLRRGERRMHVANAELQRLSEQRRDFLRIAVPNLKAPPGAATMFLTNMRDGLAGTVTDKQREWIGRCLKRLEEQSTFLQEMQVLSSLEKEIIRSTYTRVDLGEIVERMIADHADIAMENGLELRLQTDRQVRPVLGHERLLREAIVNYISNALKYTPTGGHVEVRLRQRGPNVRVEVADDGEGIAHEDQARLFGEFVRILRPGSVAERVKGTGLGLSLVKRIVDAHNGSVGVESEPGVGSTFWLELPGLFE